MNTTNLHRTALLIPLALALASACNQEPRWLEPGEEMPPGDPADLAAAKADPGYELYVPTEEEEAKHRLCSMEEYAAIREGGGRVTAETLGCIALEGPEKPRPGQMHIDE